MKLTMILDVNETLNFILDTQNLELRRAVNLFEFEVALHFGKFAAPVTDQGSNGPGEVANEEFRLSVPPRILRAARLLAANKMMEYLEKKVRTVKPRKKPSLEALAAFPDFRSPYDEEFVEAGGWFRIRNTLTAREFDDELSEARKRAKSVSQLVDFSLRFEPNPEKPRQRGGVIMAWAIVPPHQNHFGPKRFGPMPGISTLKERWAKLCHVSPEKNTDEPSPVWPFVGTLFPGVSFASSPTGFQR